MPTLMLIFVAGAVFGLVLGRFLPSWFGDERTRLRLARMEGREEGRTEGKAEALSAYRIEIQPYYNVLKVGRRPFTKRKIEAGFQYQLFVNNLPCLGEKNVVPQTSVEYDIDLEALTKMAIRMAQSLALPDGAGMVVTVLDVLRSSRDAQPSDDLAENPEE